MARGRKRHRSAEEEIAFVGRQVQVYAVPLFIETHSNWALVLRFSWIDRVEKTLGARTPMRTCPFCSSRT